MTTNKELDDLILFLSEDKAEDVAVNARGLKETLEDFKVERELRLTLANDSANHLKLYQAERERSAQLVKALKLAPIHVTPDGVWWNFRVDPSGPGACMIQVYGEAAEVVRVWSDKVNQAIADYESQR